MQEGTCRRRRVQSAEKKIWAVRPPEGEGLSHLRFAAWWMLSCMSWCLYSSSVSMIPASHYSDWGCMCHVSDKYGQAERGILCVNVWKFSCYLHQPKQQHLKHALKSHLLVVNTPPGEGIQHNAILIAEILTRLNFFHVRFFGFFIVFRSREASQNNILIWTD